MSTVDTMDPTTFTVPSGQALLYTEVSGSETLFKYKLSSGTTGTVNAAILTALGVKVADLPVLIYQTDLLACLNESFATVADLTIATGAKASIDYVKKMAATKVNKSDYLTRMAQTPTVTDMETSLSTKADQSDVESALDGKADASNVYSKEETNSLIASALAGRSAVADQTTIEGAGTDVSPLTLSSTVKTQLSGLETAKHTHLNISVLDKFSEDADGKPLYNGSVIVGGGTGTGSGDPNIIESISLNGELVEITNKNANITIDFTQFAGANHNHVFANVDGLIDLETTVGGTVASVVELQSTVDELQTSVAELEEKAHVHNGGRIKTFDPSVDIVGTTDGEIVELDFNTGTRWKVKSTTGALYLCGKHFIDGAEAYVIVYAGSEVYIDFNGNIQGDLSDDATQFSEQVFVDMTGAGTSLSDIVTTTTQSESGFAMFKLMVVDDVMIVKLIANTLN